MLQSFCDWIHPHMVYPRPWTKTSFFWRPLFGAAQSMRLRFAASSLVSVSQSMIWGGPLHQNMFAIFFSNHSRWIPKKGRFSSCPSPRISWNSPQLTSHMKFQQLGFPTSRFKSSMTWFTTSMCSSCQQVIPLHLPSKKNNGRSPKAAILATKPSNGNLGCQGPGHCHFGDKRRTVRRT